MTQENHNINRQLLDHLESGTWDPYRQQHISASDKARLVFDIQQRVRRTNMQRLTSRPFRAMVWVLVLFMFAAAGWAFINQSQPDTVDNLVNPNPVQPGQAGEENTPAPYNEAEQIAAAGGALRFGDDLYLSDYFISTSRRYGQTYFNFSLFWNSARDVTGQLNVFVHLARPDGSIIALHEAPVFVSDGTSPQGVWGEGKQVEQFLHFTVGDELAAAELYNLYFGLYDVASGERLPVIYFDQPQADNQMQLAEVRLNDNEELIISPNSDGTLIASLHVISPVGPEHAVALHVSEDELLLLSNGYGTAIITFEFAPQQDGIVTYQWRYRPADGGLESTGQDTLQEVYARTPTANGFLLVDMGSDLHIIIADMEVEWSYNNDDGGWIYYQPALLEAQAISGDFATFDLSTVTP